MTSAIVGYAAFSPDGKMQLNSVEITEDLAWMALQASTDGRSLFAMEQDGWTVLALSVARPALSVSHPKIVTIVSGALLSAKHAHLDIQFPGSTRSSATKRIVNQICAYLKTRGIHVS